MSAAAHFDRLMRHPRGQHRVFVAILLLLIVLAPARALIPKPAAAQSDTPDVNGNAYTGPIFGVSLTWDDSWIVVNESSQHGYDHLALDNGDTFLNVETTPPFFNVQACVAYIYRSIKKNKTFSNVRPVVDDAGSPVKGGGKSRAFAAYAFTYTDSNGSSQDLASSIDCRSIAGGDAMLALSSVTALDGFFAQVPVVEGVLSGLVLPSPGEPGPAFVAGPWRVSVVAAVRSSSIKSAGLKAKSGKDWLVLAVDITDWSAHDLALAATDFGVRLDGVAKPVGLAPKTTAAVSATFGTMATDDPNGIAFTAGQTQRIMLVFQIPAASVGPALTLQKAAMPLPKTLTANADLTKLPGVVGPPHLRQAKVTRISSSGVLLATLVSDSSGSLTIALIGVEPMTDTACFASTAAAKLKKMVGKTIWLETDSAVPDAEGLARYVWVENTDGSKSLLNQQLLVGGYNEASSLTPRARFQTWLSGSERSAALGKEGLWKACANPSPASSGTPSAAPNATATPLPGGTF